MASVSSTSSMSHDIEALKQSPLSSTEKHASGDQIERGSVPRSRISALKFKLSNIKLTPDTKVIYDAILGLSDGLTVPFALTAGLASVGSTRIVIMGGLAELVAGAISMGLGGFVGSKSEAEAYDARVRDCKALMTDQTHEARQVVATYFEKYALAEQDRCRIVDGLMASTDELQEFLLTHHYETSRPDTSRPYISAITLGLSYFLGGFIALIPYLCVRETDVYTALYISIGVMAFVMFVFGYIKTAVVRGWRGQENILASLKGAIQMLVIGALAVGAAVGLVRAIEAGHGY